MATAAVTTTLVNGTANSATPVNGNFTDLVTFLNNSVTHRDGTKAFTGNQDMGSNKITGLAAGTASTDAVNLGQVTLGDSNVTGAGVVLGTGGTTINTISLTVPAAGMALVVCSGTVTTAGVTFSGTASVSTDLTIAGAVPVGLASSTEYSLASNTTSSVANYLFLVPLISGLNTITLTGTRTNAGTPLASGGTLTADTGFRLAIVGIY